MPRRRLWLAISVGVAMSVRAASTPASDGNKLQCIEAHEQAQVMRQAGHLKSARQKLLVCTRSVCPAVVQQECGTWLEQVSSALPTVVFSVHDQRGADITAVRVSVDGDLLVERLDGRPIEVDPGQHTFRFDVEGRPSIERPWVLREGEKDRALVVEVVSTAAAPAIALPSATPPPAPAEPERVSSSANVVVGTVVGVVGLAALSSAIAFAVAQNDSASKAHAACPNGCVAGSSSLAQADSDVSSAKTQRVWEGVSFGVAGVALGIASYFLFARPITTTTSASPESTGLGADASPRGAKVVWGARF